MASALLEESGSGGANETNYNFLEAVNHFYRFNGSNVRQPHIDYLELFKYLVDMPESAGVTKHRKAICALYRFSQYENYGLSFVEHKNLLHILMAHAGVYISCFHREYTHANYGHVLDNFWKQNLTRLHVRILLCENCIGHISGKEVKCCYLCECGQQNFQFLVNHCGNFSDLWSQFEKKHKSGTKKVFILIASIIKNLTSHSIKDAQMIACDNTCLRFVVLLLYCTVVELKEAGLEILINISRWMVLQHPMWRTYLNVVRVANCDINISLKHLKIIQKWCETTQDGSDRHRAKQNYEQIKSYVKFNDISQLLFYCAAKNSIGNCTYILEAIWNLSRLENSACNAICSENSLTCQLFALVTWTVGNKNDCEKMSSATTSVSNGINTEANDLHVTTPQQKIQDAWKMFLNSLNTNEIPNGIELPKYYGNFLRTSTAEVFSNLNDPNIHAKARIVVKVAQAIIRNLVISADEGRRIAFLYKHQLTLQMQYDPADDFLQWLLTELRSKN